MKTLMRVLLNTGFAISLLFGVWHFFIPYMFQWYSYIPTAPRPIIVSIDWINFLFSLLLAGNSILLIINQKKIVKKEKSIFSFYLLLLLCWFARVVITFIDPWNQPFQFMDIIQITVFTIEFIILLIPCLYFFIRKSDS
jgi:hypothetical protein